jgi:MoaA/NifB/PqqE/SkfB family radical SAM enzyme
MGIHYLTLSGGEPFIRKDLFELFRKYPDVQFLVYTNGLLIDDAAAKQLAELGNAMPMLSVEGFEETTDRRRNKGTFQKLMATMDRLHAAGVLYGFSATATCHNWDEISSEEFIKLMLDKGCFYGWYFQYVPIGRNPDTTLMVKPDQRDQLRRRIYKLRNQSPIFLADFWNDGPEIGGCMAGGKRYLHINSSGDIEPCVFVHFAVDNIRDKTLTEALKSPFFTSIRTGIPYDGNLLRACMIIDRPDILREHCAKHGARPTHEGGDSILTTLAGQMDANAKGVAQIYDKAWNEKDWMRVYPDPPADYV